MRHSVLAEYLTQVGHTVLPAYLTLVGHSVLPTSLTLMGHSVLPAYLTLVGLLSRVSPHMDDEHVLSFERLLFPAALRPPAHKRLLVTGYVLLVHVLQIHLISEIKTYLKATKHEKRLY